MDRDNLRQVSVSTLTSLAETNSRIVVCDGDSKEPLLLSNFFKRFPERSISFGISEQNMVTAAAGLASTGLIPFVHNYTQFIVMRALDQIRNTVAYPRLNVKFCSSHGGLDCGQDGITHQTIEDLAIMRAMPNMVVLVPADSAEVREVIHFATNYDGPVYIRLPKSKLPGVHQLNYRFRLGEPSILREGRDLLLIACGVMVEPALVAADKLRLVGVDCSVVNQSSIKPMNEKMIVDIMKRHRAVVTVEDHSIIGGLGGAISEIASRNYPIAMESVGVLDHFGECGLAQQLFEKYQMNAEAIVFSARKVLERVK